MTQNISSEEINLSIIDLDKEHDQFIELGEELNEYASKGKENKVLLLTLANIIKMTREHFMQEESLMLRLRFPEYAEHKSEHTSFLNDLLRLYDSIKEDEDPVTLEDTNYICGWFFMHTNEADAELVTFLKNCA